MKNLLKKLHIMSQNNQSEDGGDGSSRANNKSVVEGSSPAPANPRAHGSPEHGKPLTGLSGWLNSVANRHSSNLSVSSSARPEAVQVAESEPASRDPDVEEEYQIQLALELSAREDPEAVQIEAVKQISLGSCALDNTPAEVVAFRYWVRDFTYGIGKNRASKMECSSFMWWFWVFFFFWK